MAAAVAPRADQTAELLQKLSLNSQAKPAEIPEPTKKPCVNQYGSVNLGSNANGQVPSFDRSVTPLLPECYQPNGYPSSFYCGGFDASTAIDWDEYMRYMNANGVDISSGVYGENGSYMYQPGYGYASYRPYSPATSPVPTMGNDGQLYGPQHYQYSNYFQPLTPSSGPFTPSPAAQPQEDLSATAAGDQKPSTLATANANSNGVANNGGGKGAKFSAPPKQSAYQNSFNSNNSYGRSTLPTSGYQDPRYYSYDGYRSPVPWVDGSMYSDGHYKPAMSTGINSSYSKANDVPSSRNQNYHSNSHYMGLHHPGAAHGFYNGLPANKLYGQFGSSFRSGTGFGSSGYDLRTSGRNWLAMDSRYRTRGRSNGYFGSGNDSIDGLTELNRGPRAKGLKSLKGDVPAIAEVKAPNGLKEEIKTEKEKTNAPLDREQYNKEDFLLDYADAKFFVIKSYSEDDVHKSIKYNVWASTPGGNKKLDAAYQDSQQKSSSCPVFLLFSINASGQFVGLAEMVGAVDFEKSVEYWQQDKWTGCFPVRWHIVKDVPNYSLKHITLENNENKPVTNSRDTQEVKLEPGLKLIKIFKEYSSKTCILDDFEFYEIRQKAIQEKKAKHQQQQIQKQVCEGKATDDKKDVAIVTSDSAKESPTTTIQTNEDVVKPSENESVGKTGVAPKGAKPASVLEKKILANGVANGC